MRKKHIFVCEKEKRENQISYFFGCGSAFVRLVLRYVRCAADVLVRRGACRSGDKRRGFEKLKVGFVAIR